MISLSQRLRSRTAPVRAACLAHPFVRGIADGSLPPAVFARWVRQDWVYLQTYAAVLQGAVSVAPAESAERWRELHDLTVNHELDLHRAFARRFGLGPTDLDRTEPTAATIAYCAFLRSSADDYPLLVASLLPCGVGYVQIARALAAGPAPPDPRYAEWIATYDDPAFRDAVRWMEGELDAHGAAHPEVPATYTAGADHELAFWDALWADEPSPLRA